MITLDRYSLARVNALAAEYEHAAARNRDIILAAVLTMAYDHYHQMQLNRVCASSDMTYTEAEQTAEKFGEIFGAEVPTEAFLPNAEKRTDISLEFYEKYKSQREAMKDFGYEESDLDAFCKMLFFQPYQYGLTWFVANNSVGYRYNMQAVYSYMVGGIGVESLQMCFKKYVPLRKLVPMTDTDKWRFAKTMLLLVRSFKELAAKRRKRNEKRKKGFYEDYARRRAEQIASHFGMNLNKFLVIKQTEDRREKRVLPNNIEYLVYKSIMDGIDFTNRQG